MGMHMGLVAAKTSVANFREAFPRTWTKFEIVAMEDHLPDANAMRAWWKSHERFVSGADWTMDNPGKEVFAFWQDGPWAVMLDCSYVLASDDDRLKDLSNLFGAVLSFAVETAGGCAFFSCFENGQMRRKINNINADVTSEGEPMPEEAGIDISKYYMDETEALWKAFGMDSDMEGEPTQQGYQAICVIDHTDYGHLHKGEYKDPKSLEIHDDPVAHQPQPVKPMKPWWKFW